MLIFHSSNSNSKKNPTNCTNCIHQIESDLSKTIKLVKLLACCWIPTLSIPALCQYLELPPLAAHSPSALSHLLQNFSFLGNVSIILGQLWLLSWIIPSVYSSIITQNVSHTPCFRVLCWPGFSLDTRHHDVMAFFKPPTPSTHVPPSILPSTISSHSIQLPALLSIHPLVHRAHAFLDIPLSSAGQCTTCAFGTLSAAPSFSYRFPTGFTQHSDST